MIGGLSYGLDWDRDYYVYLAIQVRHIYWPIAVFFIHPLAIFIVLRKTKMSKDYKAANIIHNLILMGFDIFNCLLYQMYTLAPLPVFFCTGLLCHGTKNLLQTFFSVFTVANCIPYLFLMIRMHQRMLPSDSPLKAKTSVQMLILLILTMILVSNVFGFHRWTVDIPTKDVILQTADIEWARNFSTNFLVLGEHVREIGPFTNGELILF
ncbi:hypothetical protein PFISCL1PPCAC_14453, partial [Pristionchus fissidentatus]